jgi:energy-coupling factor transport system ATP-binding protein
MISLQCGFYHHGEELHKAVDTHEPAMTQAGTGRTVRSLRGVTVAFRTADGVRRVLEEIDLALYAGEFVALVGANGSGKSTLARVIAGLSAVSRGQTEGEGRGAIVFQHPEAQIVGETVYEDVCFGLENLAVPTAEMPHRARAALDRVGLRRPPDQPVASLSGGQKQLLAAAGNLVLEPRLLVFDESTSMLDPAGRQRLLLAARALADGGTCVVWVTQWMDEAAQADRVVALAQGRVVFDGSPAAFFYGGECMRLGFEPPYVVRAAQALRQRGIEVGQPLTAEALADAIARAVAKHGGTCRPARGQGCEDAALSAPPPLALAQGKEGTP